MGLGTIQITLRDPSGEAEEEPALPPSVSSLTLISVPGSADSLPSVGVAVADRMGLATTRTRISDRAARMNHYAPQAAWNCDGSYMCLLNLAASATADIIEGDPPYTPVVQGLSAYGYWWHPTDPEIMFMTPSGGVTIKERNVITGSSSDIKSWSSTHAEVFMDGHIPGPSWDGRYFPITGRRTSDNQWQAWIWDRTNNTDSNKIDVGIANQGGGDRISISPSGAYATIVTENPTAGAQDFHVLSHSGGTLAFMSYASGYHVGAGYRWSTGRIFGQGPHWTWGKDSAGADSIVIVTEGGRFASSSGPWMIRASDGHATNLNNSAKNAWNSSGHLSCAAYDLPGWVWASDGYTRTSPDAEGYLQVVALRMVPATSNGGLTAAPEYKPYGYTESGTWLGAAPTEQAQPLAVPDRTGRRVLFSTGMRASSNPTCYAYILEAT